MAEPLYFKDGLIPADRAWAIYDGKTIRVYLKGELIADLPFETFAALQNALEAVE